jgi:glycosyltransferase involved in cell wall biosynthesis
MHIGLVVPGRLGSHSGGYLYDRMLVSHLQRRGDRVEIITVPREGYAASVSRGLDPRLLARMSRFSGDVLLQDELAHPSLAAANTLTRRRGRPPRVALVHLPRACARRGALLAPLERLVETAYLAGVNGFVFNSESTRLAVADLVRRPVRGVVAPPGGDRLHPRRPEAEALARSGEFPLRILFAANLLPGKGLHTLLGALSLLSREDWLLTVAGSPMADPRYAARTRGLTVSRGLGDRVRFMGHLGAREIAGEYACHHVLAVPSSYEAYGIVYAEAMGFGVVPVGTAAGGAAEIIQNGVSGFLVPPGNEAFLARILSALARDRGLLRTMTRAAYARFEELPTWEQSMERVRSALLQAAGGQGR